MSVSAAELLEILNDLYLDACRELCSAYGLAAELDVEAAAEPDRTAGFVSAVTATGDGIKLLSTASIDADLLAHSHLLGNEHTVPRVLQDWCRELNHQLLGRVKNKLLECDCEVVLGLPAFVTGTDLPTHTERKLDTCRYVFASPHGSMMLTLQVVLAPDFTLDLTSPSSEGTVMHAGAVLF